MSICHPSEPQRRDASSDAEDRSRNLYTLYSNGVAIPREIRRIVVVQALAGAHRRDAVSRSCDGLGQKIVFQTLDRGMEWSKHLASSDVIVLQHGAGREAQKGKLREACGNQVPLVFLSETGIESLVTCIEAIVAASRL
jgi:hypothetical protein